MKKVNLSIHINSSERGYINVTIPSFGISTIAKDENDIIEAVQEAIYSFCYIAEEFGKGVEEELKFIIKEMV